MYEASTQFAQTWGLILFVAMFIGAVIYALWPRNQKKFDEAARSPLSDKEPGDE